MIARRPYQKTSPYFQNLCMGITLVPRVRLCAYTTQALATFGRYPLLSLMQKTACDDTGGGKN